MKQKTKKSRKAKLRLRLTGLFFAVFILFSVLIVRLGIIQIVSGEEYAAQVKATEVTPVSSSVPRGKIYDTNHKLVVYNIPEKAITFTPPLNPQPEELLERSKKIARFLVMNNIDIKKVTSRDLKDIWLLEHDNGEELLTEPEKKLYEEEKVKDKDLYKIKLERIKE